MYLGRLLEVMVLISHRIRKWNLAWMPMLHRKTRQQNSYKYWKFQRRLIHLSDNGTCQLVNNDLYIFYATADSCDDINCFMSIITSTSGIRKVESIVKYWTKCCVQRNC